jgi:hypothetical protein
MQTRPRKGQFAFWSYDQFPYFLGGEVTAVLKDEHPEDMRQPWLIQADGYGFHWFPALVVTTPSQGKALLELRERLQTDRRYLRDAVDRVVDTRLRLALHTDQFKSVNIIEQIINKGAKRV